MTARRAGIVLLVTLIDIFVSAPDAANAATVLGIDLKDIGSFTAIVISLVALVATQMSTAEKTRREKREELKAAIEKLIDLRSELNTKMPTFTDESTRLSFSSMQNTRKLIYLEWAERLAHELPYVTPAEWLVLGGEHMFESNFARARKTFESAVHASRGSSAVTQATSMRQLALVLMQMGSQTWSEGRKYYAKAVGLTRGQADPYSRYTSALTYRSWAEAELTAGNLTEARDRLGDALREAGQMPVDFEYRGVEARCCALDLATLSQKLFAAGSVEAARETLTAASDALAAHGDAYSLSVRAKIMLQRAELENAGGDQSASMAWAVKARALIANASNDRPQPAQARAPSDVRHVESSPISGPSLS